MAELFVGNAVEFTDGTCRVIAGEGCEIGVCRIGENFFAYKNHCPHQGGPVCQGKIIHKVEEKLADDKTSLGLRYSNDRIHIVCHWHGYEFDMQTGIHSGNTNVRLKGFKVEVRSGKVYVQL